MPPGFGLQTFGLVVFVPRRPFRALVCLLFSCVLCSGFPPSNQFNVYVTKHDALDYWMGTRLLHSLMEAAWNNDKTARRICMGNGDTLQTTIAGGQMRGPIVTDTPWMSMLHSWNSGLGFMGDCEAPWNMRQYVTADACFILDIPEVSAQTEVKMYPNPAQTNRQITFESSGCYHFINRTIFIQ